MNSLIEKFSLLTVIKYEEMVALGFEVFDKELPSTLLKKVHVIVKTITEIVISTTIMGTNFLTANTLVAIPRNDVVEQITC